MTANEFNQTAIRTETPTEVQFDVRPFGNRQGQAIDSYLHEVLAQHGYGTVTPGTRTWVLLHDSTAKIPQSAHDWLASLAAKGFSIEIRQAPRNQLQPLSGIPPFPSRSNKGATRKI